MTEEVKYFSPHFIKLSSSPSFCVFFSISLTVFKTRCSGQREKNGHWTLWPQVIWSLGKKKIQELTNPPRVLISILLFS